MSATYLDDILVHHRARAMSDTRDWRERVGELRYDGPSMLDALRREASGTMGVIAEVKRRSPSKGALAMELDVTSLASTYARAGACAISVLTDQDFFSGSVDDLITVEKAVSLPILRKDFTVCENDVLDACEMGASTVLLIVAALSGGELERFFALADLCGMEALVEVHDEEEARRAQDCGARIIGVNQRNLRTFVVDPQHAASVIDAIDPSVVSVCESGLSSPDDVVRASETGFDAVLVGESFVTSSHVLDTVQSFTTVAWTGRG
jgi:indole-3-glycerol phosphate synthase